MRNYFRLLFFKNFNKCILGNQNICHFHQYSRLCSNTNITFSEVYYGPFCRYFHSINSCQRISGLLNSSGLNRTSLRSSFRFRNMSSAGDDSDRNVNYQQLTKLLDDGNITLIDVREKDELKQTGEIKNSFNIPVGEIQNALNNLSKEVFQNKYGFCKPSVDDTLVFSCRSGKRSLVALQEALKAGYKNSLNFTGGWLEWEKNDGIKKTE